MPEPQSKMPEITHCKSCQAKIFFIQYKGKAHPLDAKPKKVFVSNEDDNGVPMDWEFVNGYESHFATCPDAQRWRDKK